MQHKAVYNAMLHMTRAELHRRLEDILRAKVAKSASQLLPQQSSHIASYSDEALWALQAQLSKQHVMRSRALVGRMSAADMEAASQTFAKLCDRSLFLGHVQQALYFLVSAPCSARPTPCLPAVRAAHARLCAACF